MADVEFDHLWGSHVRGSFRIRAQGLHVAYWEVSGVTAR